MYPVPGHLAVSLLGHRCLRAELIPVILGGIVPDIVDKVLSGLVHAAPYGRSYMHSLIGLAVSIALVTLIKGRRWGYGWAVGHLGHLIGDISFIPWFYPFVQYHFPQDINFFDPSNLPQLWNPRPLILESSALLLVLLSFMSLIKKRKELPLILAVLVIGVRLWP